MFCIIAVQFDSERFIWFARAKKLLSNQPVCASDRERERSLASNVMHWLEQPVMAWKQWSAMAGWLASRTLDPRVLRSESRPIRDTCGCVPARQNALPLIARVFSDRTVKIVGPFYPMSMPIAMGSKRPHSCYINVTWCGLTHSSLSVALVGYGRVVQHHRPQSVVLHDTPVYNTLLKSAQRTRKKIDNDQGGRWSHVDCPRITSFSLVVENEQSIKLTSFKNGSTDPLVSATAPRFSPAWLR